MSARCRNAATAERSRVNAEQREAAAARRKAMRCDECKTALLTPAALCNFCDPAFDLGAALAALDEERPAWGGALCQPNGRETPMNRRLAIVSALAAAVLIAGCGSNADTVSDNLGKEAEKFNVQRHIVGINGITDKVLFEVEGRCSLEFPPRRLDVVCKHGPDDYRKHFIGLSDNVTYVNVQTKGLDVSEYRTKIIIRPESIVPDFDLVTGDAG